MNKISSTARRFLVPALSLLLASCILQPASSGAGGLLPWNGPPTAENNKYKPQNALDLASLPQIRQWDKGSVHRQVLSDAGEAGPADEEYQRPKVVSEETYELPDVPGIQQCKKRHLDGEASGMHRKYRNLRVRFADPNDNAVQVIDAFLEGRACEKNFFMVWSTIAESFSPREMRAVESIFKFHPRGCVFIISSSLTDAAFSELTELGFAVKVVPIDVHHLLEGTPAQPWLARLETWRKEPHFHSNISNAIRKAVLFRWGGVYLDFDTLVLRRIDVRNALSWMDPDVWLNGGVMVFDRGHPYLEQCLKDFVDNYNGRTWGHNGPTLLTRMYHKYKASPLMESNPLNILPHTAFYPIRVYRIQRAFTNNSEAHVHKRLKQLMSESYVLHYYNNVVASLPAKKGSIMDHLFHCICILCYAIV